MRANMTKYIPPGAAELSVYINKDLKMDFKLACVAQNKSMSQMISYLVKQWLDSRSSEKHEDKGAA